MIVKTNLKYDKKKATLRQLFFSYITSFGAEGRTRTGTYFYG